MTGRARPEARIEATTALAYTIPTDRPESDGTLAWEATTLVLVEVMAGGQTGIGYTYSDAAAATLVNGKLSPTIEGMNALATPAAWAAMVGATRNLGRPGITSMAIAAVDTALWDLKGKLLGLSLAELLGPAREAVPVYGSGGFTSYDDADLAAQLAGWAEQGIGRVKMKAGRQPAADRRRLTVAREAIGPGVELFVDVNGALTRKDALGFAETAVEFGVRWLEEPVSSNDLDGLRLIRDRGPAGMAVTAGEYGFDGGYFRAMLAAGAVDVLQPDATRCAGVTGFMEAAAVARAFETPISAHCAPSLHLHTCLAAPKVEHVEWFHDHARIETMLFEGAPSPREGMIRSNGEPGLGLVFKRTDAQQFATAG